MRGQAGCRTQLTIYTRNHCLLNLMTAGRNDDTALVSGIRDV
jgi:hypothetical protein